MCQQPHPDFTLKLISGAFHTHAVSQMAEKLSYRPAPKPISVKALVAEFIQDSSPGGPEYMQIGTDSYLSMSWRDPGFGTYWAASCFHITLTGTPATVSVSIDNPPSSPKQDFAYTTHADVESDTLYTFSAQAFNDYGVSPIPSVTFEDKSSSPGGGWSVGGEEQWDGPDDGGEEEEFALRPPNGKIAVKTAGMPNYKELGLRARQTVRSSLDSAGLWHEAVAQRTFMSDQRQLGIRLKNGVLQETLGAEDYARLAAVTVFGSRNQAFKFGLPILLAAGYELGSGLCAVMGGANADEAGRVCAAFNLGTTLFDTLADSYPALFDEVSHLFDENILQRILSGASGAYEEMLGRIAKAQNLETRLTLRPLAWSLSRIPLLHPRAGTDDGGMDAVIGAYRAEIRSLDKAIGNNPQAMEISRTKSTLPFSAIFEIARPSAGKADDARIAAARQLVSSLAVAMWLVDDLVDVARDLRSGALNSIVVRARGTPDPGQDEAETGRVLAALLKGNDMANAGQEVRANLGQAIGSLRSAPLSGQPAARLAEAILSYVQSAVGQ